MPPINPSFGAALDRLQAKIKEASTFLSRTPGSRRESCLVNVNDEMDVHAEHGTEDNYWLCYTTYADDDAMDSYETVCVQRDYVGVNGHSRSVFSLFDLPISRRIAVAKRLPELIAAAVDANGDLETDAVEACDSIEHAIASVTRFQ